ncbi:MULTISPECIES: PAS domain S-box protein [unclassified Methanoregula]|uniref:PAS domain S-box protein n=1 Tax=unclassified Methanoregula TaxID=2649730 RepID=UPI0009C8586E|nr:MULTISPECIES: PAS domain-containing sensor histidine kinase [unclassified Methanoregula]OPX65366.1 MAG: sensory histidine kinase AtoS [Methanoregula sp. PtaB.Bin085]OPY32275.1 MAG: sensory histidine kinase AtoS [Methanoregula sp. PtaU1.Bin006]
MEIDNRTVLLLLFLVSALLACLLLVYWKTQKTYDGFSIWAGATAVVSCAYLFITLRGIIAPAVSIVLANTLVVLSVLLRMDSIHRFIRGQKILPMAYAALVPVFFLILYYTYVSDSVALRGLVISAVIVPGLLAIAVILLQSGTAGNRTLTHIFAGALSFYALIYALRTINWLISTPETVFSTDQLNSIFFIITLLVDLLAAGLFLMLNMARARSDLAASEERYRTLADSLPDYVVVHDGSAIRYANPATRDLLGIPEDRIAGLPIDSFIAPESRAVSAGILGRIRTDPAAGASHEITIIAPGGGRHICIVRSVPVRFGGSPAILSVLTDITERKQMEDALRTVNRKLNLLSGMTRHDIRNQLMALGGFLEISKDTLSDPAKTLGFIDREVRITNTIAAQIEFTKDYEDLGVTSPSWQSVESVVKDAAASLTVQGVRLEIQCPGLEIYADRLLPKVFYNLIDNTLRYAGPDLSLIRVSVQERPGKSPAILYEDDGAGISAEDKKRLFTRGFGRNTGLGLFLSREILAITGITITENGVPGTGARFEIVLPERGFRYGSDRPPS